jgi:sec-independent protein translocase protein TatC
MLVCLIAANQVLTVVTWPLKRADKYRKPPGTELFWIAGTNTLGTSNPGTEFIRQFGITNQTRLGFDLVPKLIGSNYVLTVEVITNDARLSAIKPRGTILRNLSPVGGFWVAFQVALYGGIVFAAPYLIYVIGGFVLPALKIKEKKYVLRGFVIGSGLFMMGVFFCYFFLMPMALRASFQYSEWLGFAADEWRAEEYISFVCKFMLGMGLGFELPVVVLTLVKIGVLNYARLKSMRRYMIVVNLFLGAILTTPEVVTQVLMFIPLQGLYELSVWIAGYWEKDERGKARARWNLLLVLLALLAFVIWASWHFHLGPERWWNLLVG